MRYRVILPIAALMAALLVAPAAQAKPKVGLSEQNPAVFDSASFKKLKLKRARYIARTRQNQRCRAEGLHLAPLSCRGPSAGTARVAAKWRRDVTSQRESAPNVGPCHPIARCAAEAAAHPDAEGIR